MIYGVARQSDVILDDTGTMIFPMFQVRIQDENGKVLKTYEKTAFIPRTAVLTEIRINLSRVEKMGR